LRVRADEHVARGIVSAIRNIALSRDCELTSVCDAGFQGSADQHWITAFAADGGNAILTADTDFLKSPEQVQAVFHTGLKVIHLPSRWAQAPRHMQASWILLWWPRIEQTIREMSSRECYRPKCNAAVEPTLERVQIEFHKADKRHKREQQRASRRSATES
jgi:hypothetical protein